MGFEDFLVRLTPRSSSPLREAANSEVLQNVVGELAAKWPCIRRDHEAEEMLLYPPRENEFFLCYETREVLFQLLIRYTGCFEEKRAVVELRYAYCNPQQITEVFCEVIEWLMVRYQLDCDISRDLGPRDRDGRFPLGEPISEPSRLRDVLLPAAEYNRRLWQKDVGSDEELPLRPEDAIRRFARLQPKPHNLYGEAGP